MKIETELSGKDVAHIRVGDLLRVRKKVVVHLGDGLYAVEYEVERAETRETETDVDRITWLLEEPEEPA